jgi:hypothetical protein
MSGTDYTTTANLGLYKPISQRAVGHWGDLWNFNADTLDTALSTDINVRNFGAKGDGITDDSAAINAALTYIRAHLTVNHGTFRLVFPGARYVVKSGLNFTGFDQSFSGGVIDGCGSEIWSQVTGGVTIDCLGSRWLSFRDLTVYGDPTTKPSIGIQIGRVSSNSADTHNFTNVKCWGHFTLASFYNFASESAAYLNCTFDNDESSATAFCWVGDGLNHWNCTSAFVTQTCPVETSEPFGGGTFINCVFQGTSTSGSIWIGRSSDLQMIRCYSSGVNNIFVLYAPNDPGASNTQLSLYCHCEPPSIKTAIVFSGAPGQTYHYINGFEFYDAACDATNSVFAIDPASAVTGVSLRNALIELGMGGAGTGKLFDTPAAYSVIARRAALPVAGVWQNPGYWSGPVLDWTYGSLWLPTSQTFVAANAGSAAPYQANEWVQLKPAATIASYSVTMPPAAMHGQTLTISTSHTITALTLVANTGQTVAVQPGTLTANTSVSYRYDGPSATWLALGHTT